MNVEQLRQSLKLKWLSYYRDNRPWLTRLGVWVNVDGHRRPSSSFILATLSVLEPQLTQMFPLIVDLSHNPDRVVTALGLDFNPDEELKTLEAKRSAAIAAKAIKMLPSDAKPGSFPTAKSAMPIPAQTDEACRGTGPNRD